MAVNVGLVFVIGAVITAVGGGGFWLLWLLTRPKKMSWKAMVYQISDGVKPPRRDKFGKVLSEIPLSDLRPYTKDVIVREEKGSGNVIFRLVKMGKAVPAVTSDTVDYWGEKDKVVSVLMVGDSCTLLKKGYNRDAGVLFEPMPHDRVNLIKSEMEIARERTKEKKDILEAITPWIVVGISMLSLVAIAYFMVQGFMEMSESHEDAAKVLAAAQVEASENYRDALRGEFGPQDIAKKEEAPETIPP